ncbi:MAG TPA: A24 family peptidase [Marmoricola sp.]|nr:A24 family peptidase [Marmoricola sp.]
MTWLDHGHPLAALVCLLSCAVLGWFVPHLIARIPEPEAEPVDSGAADVTQSATVAEPEQDPDADTDISGVAAATPAAGAREKVPYVEIARSPGLAVRAAVTSALVGAVLGASVGLDWVLPCLVFLTPVGVALAVVDWRTMLLPTKVIAPSYAVVIVLLLLAAAVQQDAHRLLTAALGWLVAGGLFWLLWRIYPKGMGYGDVRLSGILGLALGYLGWPQLLVGVYAGFLIGGLGGLVLAGLRLVQRKRFPFGPFMLVGAVVGVVLGPTVAAGLGY